MPVCLITAGAISVVFRNEWPLIEHSTKKLPHDFPQAELHYVSTKTQSAPGPRPGRNSRYL